MPVDKGLRSTALAPEDELEVIGPDDELDMYAGAVPDEEFDIIELDDGSVELRLVEDVDDDAPEFSANLAEYMSDDELGEISGDLVDLVNADIDSRADWVQTFTDGLEILGLKYEEQTTPWENACGVHSTVLAEAAIRFQAETMSETFPPTGLVKTKIIGKETKEKEEAAERVRVDMNYQLMEQMTEYRPEHEKMLWSLGLGGSAFKKIYKDPTTELAAAPFLPAEDVIVPYGASTIETAERVTHRMRKTQNELEQLQSVGFYRDIEIDEPEADVEEVEDKKVEGFSLDNDKRHTFYEIHVTTVLPKFDDETKLAKPYVITIDKASDQVLGIRRNWVEGDPKYTKRQHFVHYTYIPGFGFYGLGLIHIVGGYAKGGTSIIRQLVDAGTLANLPGGLKSKDVRFVKGDDDPVGPGEWKDVETGGMPLKDAMIPMPYGEPSPTLLKLLEVITSEGRRLGAIADMDVSDMSANAPVGTTLALLERALKPMAAVASRVHYAQKREFKLLKAILADSAGVEYEYQPQTGEMSAKQSDYAIVDVIPVSDPNSTTMAQRVVQYQAVHQLAQGAPEIYDLPYLHRQMIEVLGVKNADKLIPMSEDSEPSDPVTENMGMLTGRPMKAFIYQDHEAHIKSHMSFIQDPMIAQTIGQNPQAQQMTASMQAHIAEHLGFAWRTKLEEKLGVTLPPPGQRLPEEVEVMLSRSVADAGQQLTQQHQKEAAQKEAQQQAEDPSTKIAQEDAITRRKEVERKTAKDEVDNKIKVAEQQRKEAKDKTDAKVSVEKVADDRRNTQLAAAQVDVKLTNERTELDRRIIEDIRTTAQGPGDE